MLQGAPERRAVRARRVRVQARRACTVPRTVRRPQGGATGAQHAARRAAAPSCTVPNGAARRAAAYAGSTQLAGLQPNENNAQHDSSLPAAAVARPAHAHAAQPQHHINDIINFHGSFIYLLIVLFSW